MGCAGNAQRFTDWHDSCADLKNGETAMKQVFCIVWTDGTNVALCEHENGICYATFSSLEEAQESAGRFNMEARRHAYNSRYFAIPLPENVKDGCELHTKES
jgi:hypothetical protein